MENAYQKGDYVRYGADGVCVVADIEAMVSADRRSTRQYYVLRPVADPGTRVFVPMDNPLLMGKIHAILTREEVDAAIAESAHAPLEWIADRNRRCERFREILKTSQPLPLLQLCCCIHNRRRQLLAEGKRLSGSDEAILKQAEKLVENEFAFSLDIRRQDVAPYIHDLWSRTAARLPGG